jgi:hypothetical protein
MQNAWIVYRQTAAATRRPLDQLEFCATYVLCTTSGTVLIASPLAVHLVDLKATAERVKSDIHTDGITHYLKSSGTKRRCGVCGMMIRRQCRKCDIRLPQECLEIFHQ